MTKCTKPDFTGYQFDSTPPEWVKLSVTGIPVRPDVRPDSITAPFRCDTCGLLGEPEETFSQFLSRHAQQ